MKEKSEQKACQTSAPAQLISGLVWEPGAHFVVTLHFGNSLPTLRMGLPDGLWASPSVGPRIAHSAFSRASATLEHCPVRMDRFPCHSVTNMLKTQSIAI